VRDGFEQYYRNSPESFNRLWTESTFAIDANVLLDLYRFSSAIREKLLSTFEGLRDRVWIPHTAVAEYHRNRLKVVSDTFEPYRKIREACVKNRDETLATLNQYTSKHPFIEIEEVRQTLRTAFDTVIQNLDDAAKSSPDHIAIADSDPVRDTLTSLFDGKVGKALTDAELEKIHADGKGRYEKRTPPGYMDGGKPEPERYGDLVIWEEMIRKSVSENKPLIFVTGDDKEDWWEIIHGKTVGPRVELLKEFKERTRNSFYMYQTGDFLRKSANFLNLAKVSEQEVEEIQAVKRAKDIEIFLNGKPVDLPTYFKSRSNSNVNFRGAPRGTPRSIWRSVNRTLAQNADVVLRPNVGRQTLDNLPSGQASGDGSTGLEAADNDDGGTLDDTDEL
jgi:PIN like domain